MKYDNRHAYTIERTREEETDHASKIAGFAEDVTWETVYSCGQPILYSHGIITGFVMMNSRGEYAVDAMGDGLVKIPVPEDVLN